HLDDIKGLIKLFSELAKAGNTLFIIEHSLDVMKQADYIVELGPGGGIQGGEVLYTGTPQNMIAQEKSVTGRYLYQSTIE
ncbi:MAG: excinuclease ABC subunit UvrA, partial [Oscillospiraceae bacterium]